MTRLGKIARLPREIRKQLNVRLRDGEVGRQLVDWLNGLPEAQAMLAAQFGGRPISEQNLTEWKQGGYEDWLRLQEDCAYARILTEGAHDLEKETGEIRLEDRLAAPMALALARLMREAEESLGSAEKQKALLGVARELALLRNGSHEADRVRLERERWETKQAEVAEQKRINEECWQRAKAHRPDLFCDDLNPAGLLPDELVVCLEASARLRRAQDERANQGESNQIKPDQTKSNLPHDEIHAPSAS
jgi:hypothetical protein